MADLPWIPPHLSHLRRDRRGLPVPWINLWGDPKADPSMLAVRPDATVRADALFMDDDGQDVPDFTLQNVQRQRQSMVYGLCQVCGRDVPWGRRFLVVAGGLSASVIDLDGEPHVALTEPWLDAGCAEVALTRCPALIRRRSTEGLTLVTVSSPREAQMVVSHGWVEGALAERTKAEPVAMWVKVLVPSKAVAT